MNPLGKYSRVYWEILDDGKFFGVYDDDRLLATWLRLLIVADMAHPATPTVPVGTNRKALDALAAAGIVETVGAHRYRIVGLSAERDRRTSAARRAAGIRWQGDDRTEPDDATAMRAHSGGNAAASRPAMLDEHRQDKTSIYKHAEDDTDADHLDAWYRLTGTFPSRNVQPWLDDLAERHGAGELIRALGAESVADSDRRTLISRTQSRLEKLAHDRNRERESAAARRAEEERLRVESMPAEQRAENLARLRGMMRSAGLEAPEGE